MDRKEIETQVARVDFRIGRSMRYHAKRRDFFQNLRELNIWFIAIGSGGTALSSFLVAQGISTQALGVLVFLLATTDKTLGFGKKAQRYDRLHALFSDLNAKIIQTKNPTEENWRGWVAKCVAIEKSEPSPIAVLNIVCRNEEVLSRGHPELIIPLRWWQRLFAQVISLPPKSWEKESI